MRRSNLRKRFSRVVVCTLVGLLASPIGAGMSFAQTTGPTFSGQATVVRANVLGQTSTLSDTGPVPSGGGQQEASLLTVSVPGVLTADVAHAAVVAQHDTSRAEASVADVNLTVGGHTITADFLMARAEAGCNNGTATAGGSSEIVGLTIDGKSVVVAGTPNQTITLPLGAGMVVINEQDSPRAGDITVNALHVVVTGVADVVISSAHADINNCAAPPPTCDSTKDFVTGGGWIIAPSGAKGTFGVAGGIKNGAFWGHLTYIDHGSGMKVKGTGVTAYAITGANTRHIEGTAEVNGESGFTYKVDVADNGEPGTQDTFSIVLSPTSYATGNQQLQGGNIQIHNPCLR